jgi:hypothetical protein
MSEIVNQIVEQQNRDAQNLKMIVECTRELSTIVKDTKIKLKELEQRLKELEQRSKFIMYAGVWFIGVLALKTLFTEFI